MAQIFLSWQKVNTKIKALAEVIKAEAPGVTRIVSIANGGRYIGEQLARILDLPHESVRISRYTEDREKRETPIVEGELTQATGNLVVDEIIDDGGTLDLFDQHFGLEGNTVAVLFHQAGKIRALYHELKPAEWLIMPWEPL